MSEINFMIFPIIEKMWGNNCHATKYIKNEENQYRTWKYYTVCYLLKITIKNWKKI